MAGSQRVRSVVGAAAIATATVTTMAGGAAQAQAAPKPGVVGVSTVPTTLQRAVKPTQGLGVSVVTYSNGRQIVVPSSISQRGAITQSVNRVLAKSLGGKLVPLRDVSVKGLAALNRPFFVAKRIVTPSGPKYVNVDGAALQIGPLEYGSPYQGLSVEIRSKGKSYGSILYALEGNKLEPISGELPDAIAQRHFPIHTKGINPPRGISAIRPQDISASSALFATPTGGITQSLIS